MVGPTAVGKSRVALSLAQSLNAEIVNADSRQVYRYMDIGTAKPTSEERDSVPHHLLDVTDPDERFSLGLYQQQAHQAINEISSRGRLPLLVGGTGLFVWAVVEGWQVPAVPPDTALRRELEDLSRREGVGALYRKLSDMDPEAAEVVDRRNPRRLVRAIEVRLRGGPPSLRLKNPLPYSFRLIGLSAPRPQLYQHIDSRVDRMIEKGLVVEVEGLLRKGYSLSLPALSGAGYREIGHHIEGKIPLEEAIQHTKYHTHRIARHQYAWFRTGDPRIHWLDINEEPAAAARRLTEEWLSEVH
ncbi:MAG: tRNA (adenosine(37)-N6)-dimethylallyltransferase MiaA [Dehalococcoidia bacterium]|nr:tRNA (adenosine(37)-N6)-dimethylallyltransferase MiaA [Dehalococcoidia bacterium]